MQAQAAASSYIRLPNAVPAVSARQVSLINIDMPLQQCTVWGSFGGPQPALIKGLGSREPAASADVLKSSGIACMSPSGSVSPARHAAVVGTCRRRRRCLQHPPCPFLTYARSPPSIQVRQGRRLVHVLATKTEYVSPSSRTSSTELQRLEALSTVSSTRDCTGCGRSHADPPLESPQLWQIQA